MAARGRKAVDRGPRRGGGNRRRARRFPQVLRLADQRARRRTNRPANRRGEKWVRAAIAESAWDGEVPGVWLRMFRWMLGLMMVPLCGVTSWTFFVEFSNAAIGEGFWRTAPFWYFATGGMLMSGWFLTGLGWSRFLYLYVLGHELTHILFIKMFRGSVSDWGVSSEGGWVTTDKSNLVISLGPYFLPLWAGLAVVLYGVAAWFSEMPPAAGKSLYLVLGFLWVFHLLWTLWMIPRDQPDLRDHGIFFSLTVIYFGNLVVLAGLMCLAVPETDLAGFALEWLRNARETGEGLMRLAERARAL